MSAPVRFSQWLGQALLPPRCLVCESPGADGHDLCAACRDALPWNAPACPGCALPLTTPAGKGPGFEPDPASGYRLGSGPRPQPDPWPQGMAGRCGRCLRRPPSLDATVAALAYRFPLDRLLPRFKFHGDLAAGRLLGQLLAEALAGRPGQADSPQALVPVPLHPRRLRERGYDQAWELARPLGQALGIPVRAGGLRRVRATVAQSTLGAAARRGNVRGAFVAGPGPWPERVALLDDVMTTGTTLNECARALKQAGVARVEAWVVARAPEPGAQPRA